MAKVESTSDERVVNNAMRHQYRVLTDEEKQMVQMIKDKGAEFIELLHRVGDTDPTDERFASGNLTLSFRHAEDAVYRAVKHITA